MKKKILASSIAIGTFALILSASTMAYFTDKTDTVTNTFTVGKVHISLDEPEKDNWSLDENGNPKMIVMPGGSYKKTPTIKVENDSQSAWVFANIKLSNKEDFVNSVLADHSLSNISEATDEQVIATLKGKLSGISSGWRFANVDATNASFTLMYYRALSAGTTVKVFSSVKIPSSLSNEDVANGEFDNATIKVTAYAIQSQGIKQANAYNEAVSDGLFSE